MRTIIPASEIEIPDVRTYIHRINGNEYAIFRCRERDILPYHTTNSLKWFAMDLKSRDIICYGIDTKKEVEEYLSREL